jgi:hypothetical protein
MKFILENSVEENRPVKVSLSLNSGLPEVLIDGKLLLWIREDGAIEFNGFLDSEIFALPTYPASEAIGIESSLNYPKIVL